MNRRWVLQLGLCSLVLTLGAAQAAAQDVLNLLSPEQMAARIDHHIEAKWTDKNAQPAPRSGDAEFLRRLSLDVNGRIPTIVDLRDFLDDTRADKRRIWLERLLEKKATSEPSDAGLYVNHFTNFWRTLIFSQTTNQQGQFLAGQLDPWLRRHLAANTPYDQMVRELLTTPQGQVFYQANENKPEVIAGSTARLFLGVKLECAQCHDDRSGGDWTRRQFWEYTAFFTDFNPQRGGRQPMIATTPNGTPAKIKLGDKNEFVEAKFLTGAVPQWRNTANAPTILAEWITTAENPFFARATVNRMWHYFMGTGLVDPVDFMGTVENPPSHPELLDELAAQFAAHKFDLKFLMRAIIGSRAYQLTSVQSHESQEDPRLFARMAVRGPSPEQLFDSIQLATGFRDSSGPAMGRGGFGFQPNNPRAEFLARFTNNDKRTERQTSILQALFLMNGKWLTQAVEHPGGCLDKIAGAGAHVPMSKRIKELYIISLSREPRGEEMEKMLKYVEATGDQRKALSDIFWALLNSAEFILNH